MPRCSASRLFLAAAAGLGLGFSAYFPSLQALRAAEQPEPPKSGSAAVPSLPAALAPVRAPFADSYDRRGRLRRLHLRSDLALAGGLEDRARSVLVLHAPALGFQAGGADLELVSVRQSPSGAHARFRQTHAGIRVWGAEAVVSFDRDASPFLLCSDLENLNGSTLAAMVNPETATATALEAIGIDSVPYAPPVCESYWRRRSVDWCLEYQVAFACESPAGDWEVWIDARTGKVLERIDRTVYAGFTGLGRVFDPDPVLASGDPALVDAADSDAAVPAGSYIAVPLRDLDPPLRGFYRLRGANASVEDWESPAGAPDSSQGGEFLHSRSAQGFEDVMVYYHIDAMQRWYRQLGFEDANRRRQVADAHGLQGQDNSKFVPSLHKMSFGEGGVDDAEDASVILHEYGHATQFDIVPTWGTGGHTGAMGEGFGDYLANSYAYSRDPERVQAWNAVFLWDGHNEFWPGRRVIDTSMRYPENAGGAVHRAGTLWCSALTEILYTLGDRSVVDRLVLDHHYAITGSATMEDAANAILASDLVLYAGAHVGVLVEIFGRWGMVDASAYKPVRVDHVPLDAITMAAGPPRIVAKILSTAAALAPDAVRAQVRTYGGAWMPLTLSPSGGDVFEAAIPVEPQSNLQLEYYLEACDVLGNCTRVPASAPETPYRLEIGAVAEPFESDGPWIAGVPGDDASSGRWIRAVPIGTAAQPYADHTNEGTACFVTGNGAPGAPVSEADVDGGRTTLLSPVFDLGGATAASIGYWRWFSNDQGSSPHEDPWVVEISNDGGGTWVEVERTTVSEPRWRHVQVDLGTLFGSLDRIRIRFVASDRGGASVVEAAVDDLVLRVATATDAPVAASYRRTAFLGISNPIPSGTPLRFALARPGPARLAVYDVRGAVVRVLVAAPLGAGEHAVAWDGFDGTGRRLPSGIYFAKLSTPFDTVSHKLVLVR